MPEERKHGKVFKTISRVIAWNWFLRCPEIYYYAKHSAEREFRSQQ